MIYFSLPLYDLEKVSRSNPETLDLVPTLEREKQALEKEKQTSKETVRKVEAEVANLVEQIPILISEARVLTVEEFKASAEMRDLNVKFSQEAFVKGFELYEEKVAKKFFELNLSFLDEAPKDEAGPSPTATDTAAPLPRTPSSSTPPSEV